MKSLKLVIVILLPILFGSCDAAENTATQQQSTTQEVTNTDNDNAAEALETVTPTPETTVEQEAITETETTAAPKENEAISPSKPTPAPKEAAKMETPTTTTQKPTNNATVPPVEHPVTEKMPTKTIVKAKTSGKPSHDAFNTLLKKYVNSSGEVNYAGFKKQKGDLEKYLKDLEENTVQNDWSRNEKMAYWINLYNAATIKLVLDYYPVSSIRDINAGNPWDKRWIKVGSKTYTLNEIENSILRPKFSDPRIHFAVNCAAKSCPRLMNQAFTASNLNKLLDENARWFINNATFNSITTRSIKISKIFEWYSGDFGNIIDYLNKYSTTTIKSNAKVSYEEYNWDLNKM